MASGHGEKLSRKGELLISALLKHSTIAAAAAAVGIGERTARRWLTDPAFLQAYRAERRRIMEMATGRIQAALDEAIDRLLALLREGCETTRMGAVKLLLEHGRDDKSDILQRIEALEARMFGPSTTAPTTNGALR
jgi:hypothetical protein